MRGNLRAQSTAIECGVTDFMALVQPLTVDNAGLIYDGASTPLHRCTPVEITVDAGESDLDYHWHVHDLAQDCVNQGGISNVRMICPPERTEQRQ